MRIEVLAAGARQPAARIRMGWKRTGRTQTRTWTPPAGVLTPGDYVAPPARRRPPRPHAAPDRARLRPLAPDRRPAAAGPRPAGARRRQRALPGPGRLHLRRPRSASSAARRRTAGRTSSPPRARRSSRRARASCRGARTRPRAPATTSSIHADDGRDFVFMHLLDGSITVTKGRPSPPARCSARSGRPATPPRPHLHFEIWPDGWYASDASQPIDPAPDLQAWAAAG